jgi:hypothetical protein
VFATQPDDVIGVDVAAFDDRGLQLLDPQLHGGYLLDQRLFWLGETPAEFGTVGVQEGSIPHGADGPLINPRQRGPVLGVTGATFDGAALFGGGQHNSDLRSGARRDGAGGLN